MSKSYAQSKTIPFTPEQIFQVIADISSYKHFLPYCADSKVVQWRSKKELDAELSIGFKAFTESYTSRVTLREPKSIVARAVESSIFKELQSKWTFEQQIDSQGRALKGTNVSFSIHFRVNSAIHARAVDMFFRDVANAQLKAFEERCHHLFGHQSSYSAPTAAPPPSKSNPAKDAHPSGSKKAYVDLELLVPSLAPFGKKMTPCEMKFLADVFHRHATVKPGLHHIKDDSQVRNTWQGDKLYLSVSEFRLACAELTSFAIFKDIASNPVLASSVFSSYDNDKNGIVSLKEFISGIFLTVQATPEEKAEHLFEVIDRRHCGHVSKEDLKAALGSHFDSVSKLIPKLVNEHMQQLLADYKENVHSPRTSPPSEKEVQEEEARLNIEASRNLAAFKSVVEQVNGEIPHAVEQVFEEVHICETEGITLDEWRKVWKLHPELLEMMSVDGLVKMVRWVSMWADEKN